MALEKSADAIPEAPPVIGNSAMEPGVGVVRPDGNRLGEIKIPVYEVLGVVGDAPIVVDDGKFRTGLSASR